MNAKIVLAAVAAVCCVQSIAAASLVRTLPWTDVSESDVAEMDFDEVLDMVTVMVAELKEETGLDFGEHVANLKEVRGSRNIISCAASVVNLVKTLGQVKQLVDEFKQNKDDLAQAKEACQGVTTATPAPGPVNNDCIKQANVAYKEAVEKSKAKIWPVALKSLTAAVGLKSCFSLL